MKTALLKGKNRWLLAAVLVIAAAAVFIGYRMIRLRRNAQAVREAMNTVETVRAVRQNLIESISVPGQSPARMPGTYRPAQRTSRCFRSIMRRETT